MEPDVWQDENTGSEYDEHDKKLCFWRSLHAGHVGYEDEQESGCHDGVVKGVPCCPVRHEAYKCHHAKKKLAGVRELVPHAADVDGLVPGEALVEDVFVAEVHPDDGAE